MYEVLRRVTRKGLTYGYILRDTQTNKVKLCTEEQAVAALIGKGSVNATVITRQLVNRDHSYIVSSKDGISFTSPFTLR